MIVFPLEQQETPKSRRPVLPALRNEQSKSQTLKSIYKLHKISSQLQTPSDNILSDHSSLKPSSKPVESANDYLDSQIANKKCDQSPTLSKISSREEQKSQTQEPLDSIRSSITPDGTSRGKVTYQQQSLTA